MFGFFFFFLKKDGAFGRMVNENIGRKISGGVNGLKETPMVVFVMNV